MGFPFRVDARLVSALAIFLPALFVAGCGTSVERMDTAEVKDLSGAWNDTDSRLVSEEMIQDVLSRDWLLEFTRKHNKKPAVIVGEEVGKANGRTPVTAKSPYSLSS